MVILFIVRSIFVQTFAQWTLQIGVIGSTGFDNVIEKLKNEKILFLRLYQQI